MEIKDINFIWVCRNKHNNEIKYVELTDRMLAEQTQPSWITTDSCEIIAKIRPTGLLDRNGKKIFEGDILRGHEDGLFIVVWLNTSWHVMFDNINGIGFDEMCIWFGNNSEIIGNIYENPELLEASNEL